MKLFRLPDLGEGLPDAEIREWYVKVGDDVSVDQPLAAMETAKALVDVPSPFTAKVEKLFGDVGDTIHTGSPLIGFEGEGDQSETKREDSGTVVGNIQTSDQVLANDMINIQRGGKRVASPSVRALARRLDIDLNTLPTENGRIFAKHVRAAGQARATKLPLEGFEALPAARRAMVLSMVKSHKEVVPVCITDDADINAWYGKENITIRLIHAVATACKAEPMLNATFDGRRMAYRLNDNINLTLAVDTPHGLYIPVLKDLESMDDIALREKINQYKIQAQTKSISQSDQQDGTIMLSNFGTIAGRYANPILLPPMVAIIGVGKLRDEVVAVDGHPAVHKVIPLSLTVDHRAITGGEAARFLRAMIDALLV